MSKSRRPITLTRVFLVVGFWAVITTAFISCQSTKPQASHFEQVRGYSVLSEERREQVVDICLSGNDGEYALKQPYKGGMKIVDGEVFYRNYSQARSLYTMDIILKTPSGTATEAVCGVVLRDSSDSLSHMQYLLTRDLDALKF